jgi:peptide-methionine (S)-S-oxide reductase
MYIYICIQVPGVVSVVAGYAGNSKHSNPSFANLTHHTEALWIEFQPHILSYLEILQLWQENDDPWEPECLRYRSAVFVTTASQFQQAQQFVQQLVATRPKSRLYCEVQHAVAFYKAEDEQQFYLAQQRRTTRQQIKSYVQGHVKSGLSAIQEY